MSNMKYCMFENTYNDLQDCYERLCDEGIDAIIEDASQYEAPYIKKLIKLCTQIAELEY
jgi:hypothetical protein